MPYPDYQSLTMAADVVLDPLHFGGGATTYDGLALGQPIVTLPSPFQRGRYTLGCYQKMDVMDCVAQSPQHYIELALRLANDPDCPQSVKDKSASHGALLLAAYCSRLHRTALTSPFLRAIALCGPLPAQHASASR
jgi:protein O-GlcNAc transferase